MELMKYSPLPASVVAKFEQAVKSAPPPGPTPQMITARARAKESEGKTQLYFAQARDVGSQNQIDAMRAQEQHERTMADAMHTAAEAQNDTRAAAADAEVKRSQAIKNLAEAEAARSGIPLDQLLGWVNVLDTLHGMRLSAKQQQIDATAAQAPAPAAA
jgi:hypothetical protein